MNQKTDRRQLLVGVAVALAAPGLVRARTSGTAGEGYGLIGKMTAVAGQRDRLVELLVAGTSDMPGCVGYDVAPDLADETTIWITEVWRSAEDHRASLELPAVRGAIAAARDLIAGMERVAETRPTLRTSG